jgi:hypothetical protein
MWSLQLGRSLRSLTSDIEVGFVIYLLYFRPLAGEHVNLLVALTLNRAGVMIGF